MFAVLETPMLLAPALRRVILPVALSGFGATLGLVFTAAWSGLLFALMLINGDSQRTFAVSRLTFVTRFSVGCGQMMAASAPALIRGALCFVFIQRQLVQGLTAGGKGQRRARLTARTSVGWWSATAAGLSKSQAPR
jgi:ABC-type glycerol-3-phosphate transport system permease component